jgi:hypothetical protein
MHAGHNAQSRFDHSHDAYFLQGFASVLDRCAGRKQICTNIGWRDAFVGFGRVVFLVLRSPGMVRDTDLQPILIHPVHNDVFAHSIETHDTVLSDPGGTRLVLSKERCELVAARHNQQRRDAAHFDVLSLPCGWSLLKRGLTASPFWLSANRSRNYSSV